ncbi:MAG: hypothetical protein COA54_06455 [Thiotrichaceae bacterium]|nr:MAG: hypothetical protein COA54_06455 [Thiotrichaceae bacterium]
MFFIDRLSRTSSFSLLVLLLTFSFMLQAQVTEPVPDVASEPSASAGKQSVYSFPKWPVRQQVKRDRVPPPPPGPYMSSALNGHSIKAPSFSHRVNKPERVFDSSNISLDTFSPDIPWPANLRQAPSRWMPENGYQYVPPQVSHNRQQAVPANNHYGYRPRSPQMNWSGMRFNPNANNLTNRTGMPVPDMRGSDNRSRGSHGPANWMPSMGYPANRGQYRPSPGNTDATMRNQDPARMNTRQGGLQ